jgi:hypothetical protein
MEVTSVVDSWLEFVGDVTHEAAQALMPSPTSAIIEKCQEL